ncbi:MAG: thiamine phosphate synthase [Rhodospirillaceae bacterium]|jgi:thiamine-phosphate pyrophosphorylase|nr:thiamine phosphate synthase [Rhodospirillaceae bacterium]MBT7944219.1 thiamine phosphate synthase [Alphaproteobacteria bacterium]
MNKTPPQNPPCRLYLVTPPRFEIDAFADALSEALDAGDVACVQLRLKGVDDDEIRRAAERLRPLVHDRDVAFLMNDRPDLALETGCDGVHIGQDDSSYAKARGLLGTDAFIGMTCHDSRDLAINAAETWANYIAFGAFFPTATKEAKGHPDPEILTWWREIGNIQAVAIGGITAANAPQLVRAGADFLAVLSAVWDHGEGPAKAVRELNAVIEAALEERGAN